METAQTEYYSVVQKIIIVGKAYVEKKTVKDDQFNFIYVNENQKLQILFELLD